MSESTHAEGEGQGFKPADGEGDQVGAVPTTPEQDQEPAEPTESQTSKERTEHLLPDSTTGDEGGSRQESNPN